MAGRGRISSWSLMSATLDQVTQLFCHFSTMLAAFWRFVICWLYAKSFQKSNFFNTAGRRRFSVLQRLVSPLFKPRWLLLLVVFSIFLQNITPVTSMKLNGKEFEIEFKMKFEQTMAPYPVTLEPFVMPTAAHHVPIPLINFNPMPAPAPVFYPWPLNIPQPAPQPYGFPVVQNLPMQHPGPVAVPIAAPVPMPAPGPIPVPVPAPQMLPYPFPGPVSAPLMLPLTRDLTSGFLTLSMISSLGALAFVAFCGGIVIIFAVYVSERKRTVQMEKDPWNPYRIRAAMNYCNLKKIYVDSLENGTELPTTSEQQELDVQMSDETGDFQPGRLA